MGTLRFIFLIVTRAVVPFGRTVRLLGRQPSDIYRPLRGLIICFANVILKEFGLCRSRGADPAVWIFRYETQKQKETVAISITKRTGRSKKRVAPHRRRKKRGEHTRAAEFAGRKKESRR